MHIFNASVHYTQVVTIYCLFQSKRKIFVDTGNDPNINARLILILIHAWCC